MITTDLTREFMHGKIVLPDPDPSMSPDSVMRMYSARYSELTTSTVQGPEVVDDKLVYSFKTIIGTKG